MKKKILALIAIKGESGEIRAKRNEIMKTLQKDSAEIMKQYKKAGKR